VAGLFISLLGGLSACFALEHVWPEPQLALSVHVLVRHFPVDVVKPKKHSSVAMQSTLL
jgi:hypothetical protein